MKIAAELTSVLQVLFVISLIKKLNQSKKELTVDFIFLNNHVNDSTIIATKKLIKHFKFNTQFFDYRNKNNHLIQNNNRSYDLLILRSRIPLKSHLKFVFSRDKFVTTGNCDNSKKVQKYFKFDDLYTVDDGLSNWENNKINYCSILIFDFFLKAVSLKKIHVVPHFLSKLIRPQKKTSHYSIFSKNKKFTLLFEFRSLVQKLSKSYKINKEVEELYVGIWPNFKDRAINNKDDQLDLFNKFLNSERKPNPENKIFIKDHPKHKLIIDSSYEYDFEKLHSSYIEAPLELIINCFPNLKNIYGFPSTSLFLIDQISHKDLQVNLLLKDNSPLYYYERGKLFNGSNVRKFFL
jgi:hypothetical protein